MLIEVFLISYNLSTCFLTKCILPMRSCSENAPFFKTSVCLYLLPFWKEQSFVKRNKALCSLMVQQRPLLPPFKNSSWKRILKINFVTFWTTRRSIDASKRLKEEFNVWSHLNVDMSHHKPTLSDPRDSIHIVKSQCILGDFVRSLCTPSALSLVLCGNVLAFLQVCGVAGFLCWVECCRCRRHNSLCAHVVVSSIAGNKTQHISESLQRFAAAWSRITFAFRPLTV